MEAIHERIQTDVVLVTWLAFLIALPVYAWLRRRGPRTQWHAHGKVPTKDYGLIDLGILVGLFFLLKQGWLWLATALPAPTSENTSKTIEPAEISTEFLLIDICIKVILASFLLSFFFLRQIDVVDLFGLDRLNAKAIAVWGLVVGILVVPLVMAVGVVASQILGSYIGELPPQPIVEAFLDNRGALFRITTVVLVVLITPAFEELVYRGFLYGVTKRFTDRYFAAIFSSLIFAAAHPGVISLVPIFTLAIFLALVYELSGSLFVPIVIHMFFNFVNLIGMLFETGV